MRSSIGIRGCGYRACWRSRCCSTATGIRSFVLLLIGSILVNWFAARQFAATRNGAVITAAIVLNLAVLGLFKYADFFTGSVAALGGFSHRPSGFRAAARHQLLHLPPHHVPRGPAARPRRGHLARPLRALHLLLPAGGGRSAGALVGGGTPVRARCVRSRLGAALRAWHHLHHDRADREGRIRRPDRTDPGSDLSGRRVRPAARRLVLARAGLRIPDLLRLRRLFGYRHRHRAAVRHSAPVQLQRAVPGDQHPGVLAALAHDAVALPAGLRVHAARRHADRGNQAHRGAVCRWRSC